MTPQELKNSILQLAIQGKLVEQRPEEGTAEELYKQIQAERHKLIKEGKIKKEKALPEITGDDIPFDIPESWKWVRLYDVSSVNGGFAFKSTAYTNEGVRVVRISDFNENGFVNTKVVRHPFDVAFEPFVLEEKNILLCMTGGTVGKSLFVKSLPEKMMTNQRVATIKINGAFPEYINYVVLSPVTQKVIQDSKNSTNDNISMDTINRFLVPLPPLEEQKRIVAKIEELLPYVDKYEESWNKLEEFNKKFPDDMQKSILQMAIQGKLVEQRPEEGTAEELYKQIQAEKQKLIKEGKIKKDKELPEIKDDEIPFDIPDSWKWVRLQELSEAIGDGIHGTPVFDDTGQCYFVNGNNLCNGIIEMKSDTKTVSEEEFKKYKKPLTKNTVLMSINGTIGNIAFYNDEHIILGKSACYVALIEQIIKEYISIILKSTYFLKYASGEATQTTIKNVSLKAIRMLPIPLTPIEEQNRIVARVEEILPLCKRLG